jgi:hypothetical protein
VPQGFSTRKGAKRATAKSSLSDGYKTKAGAKTGIESVQKNAPGEKVEDFSE